MEAAALEAKRRAEQELQDAAKQAQHLEKQGPLGEAEEAARRLADVRGEVFEAEKARDVLLHDAKQLEEPAKNASKQAREYVEMTVCCVGVGGPCKLCVCVCVLFVFVYKHACTQIPLAVVVVVVVHHHHYHHHHYHHHHRLETEAASAKAEAQKLSHAVHKTLESAANIHPPRHNAEKIADAEKQLEAALADAQELETVAEDKMRQAETQAGLAKELFGLAAEYSAKYWQVCVWDGRVCSAEYWQVCLCRLCRLCKFFAAVSCGCWACTRNNTHSCTHTNIHPSRSPPPP